MLDDKRILITGANGGIGSSIAEKLLIDGGYLFLFYHNNKSEIENILKNHPDKKNRIRLCNVDLLDSTALENILTEILSSSHIDIFIHSVTLPIAYNEFLKLKWEDYLNHLNLQTKSFLNIMHKLVPVMSAKKYGKVICILTSSTVGKPPANMSDYIVGKYALLGLAKSLSVELASHGITVNCISPSLTNTPLTHSLPNKLKEITISQIPLKRLAEPNDIAAIVRFFCSNDSDYVNGENFLVTGGYTMH